MIHPRLCNTMNSGELKSLLETRPVLIQNSCVPLNVSEAEIKSAASRRVRKSRGEQPSPRHNKTPSSNAFIVRIKFALLLREDFNQLRAPAGQERRGRDLSVKFLRPAPGKGRAASRALAFWSQLIFFDGICEALN